jgi:hypothetical protein
MTKSGLEQSCGLRWEPHDLILARFAPDSNLDLITLAEVAKPAEPLGRLAVPIREFDKSQYLGGHGRFLPEPNHYRASAT